MTKQVQDDINSIESPFHHGEQQMQARAGKREQAEQIGARFIRDYMPDQHRDFYQQLPFIAVGSVDSQGCAWASIVCGQPGFVQSPTSTTLALAQTIFADDPLKANLTVGAPLGFLGIELETRRRNRINGWLEWQGERYFQVKVEHAFGNCPKYIKRRQVSFINPDNLGNQVISSNVISEFNQVLKQLIAGAETFFVASYFKNEQGEAKSVDISHRGGDPGFITLEDNGFVVPDFPGNNHFNTLGNFLLNPNAGVTFVDFTNGDIVMLSGRVSILEKPQLPSAFADSYQRAWRFTFEQGIVLNKAMPFTFENI